MLSVLILSTAILSLGFAKSINYTEPDPIAVFSPPANGFGATAKFRCTFSSGSCGMTSSPSGNWQIQTGQHSRGSTGVIYGDVDNRSGSYMYYDSSKVSKGTATYLTSPSMKFRTSSVCLKFFLNYYTDASASTSTKIIMTIKPTSSSSFRGSYVHETQGPRWQLKNEQFTVTPFVDYQIMFYTEARGSTHSDIAVDHIAVYEGNCWK